MPVGGGKTLSEARKPVIIERNGVKVAFLAYSQFAPQNPGLGVPAMAPLNPSYIKEDIAEAKKQASVVIVSLHWGTEYETSASEEQKFIARQIIDHGALLVIGHHPHVIQEVEEYGGGLIAYSLGNFIFDQNFSEDTGKGMMLNVTVQNNKIKNYVPTTVRFTDRYQPFVE